MFINKKKRKGKIYYSIDVCERINGKPKNKTILYLGNLENVYKKMSAINSKEHSQLSTEILYDLECGASLALYSIIKRLGLSKIINDRIHKRNQLIDYGSAFEILTIKNCIQQGSLDSIPLWFENSILSTKYDIMPNQLNSNNYCNWFIPFTKKEMKAIFEDISLNGIKKFKLSKKKIIIDFSNITTYQKRKSDDQFAQRGKPKDHKKYLRQVNYALAVTLDGIPITYDTYAGNINDPTEFKKFVKQVITMIEKKFSPDTQYVFTFDKGMLGEDCIEPIETKNRGNKKILFVSALRPSMVKEYFNDKSLKFKPVYQNKKAKVIEVSELRHKIYGKEYRTLITYSKEKYEEDFAEFLKKYSETILELEEIRKNKLNGPHWSDIKKVTSKINKLISNAFTKNIILAEINKKDEKLELIFKTDEIKLQEKINRFGKSAIFTNDDSSTKKEIVTRYFREKNTVELCNKYLKNPNFCNIDPLRCSKDQNINIRVGICCLSLMVGLLLEKKLRRLNKETTIMPAIENLKQLRHVKTTIKPLGKEFAEVVGKTEIGHKYFEFLKLNQLL